MNTLLQRRAAESAKLKVDAATRYGVDVGAGVFRLCEAQLKAHREERRAERIRAWAEEKLRGA